MQNLKIHISLPAALLNKIDQELGSRYASRSGFIRQAVLEKLNRLPADRTKLVISEPALEITDEEFLEQLSSKYPSGN